MKHVCELSYTLGSYNESADIEEMMNKALMVLENMLSTVFQYLTLSATAVNVSAGTTEIENHLM